MSELTFEQWLGLVARHAEWNGRMRTPRAWRELFDAGYSVQQAAKFDKVRFHLVANRGLTPERA